MKKFSALSLIAILVLGLAGCAPEKSARDSIAAGKGVLVTLQQQHGDSCRANPQQPLCQEINRGVALQNVAIDALEVYCSGPEFDAGTGPCQPPSDKTVRNAAANKLAAALADFTRIIADLRKAIKP
jgi:hypothetical protein